MMSSLVTAAQLCERFLISPFSQPSSSTSYFQSFSFHIDTIHYIIKEIETKTTMLISLREIIIVTFLIHNEVFQGLKFAAGFSTVSVSSKHNIVPPTTMTRLFLRTNVQVPLLDLLDEESGEESSTVTPLPSSHLPAEVATPFLYGMQVETPVRKLMLEEATSAVTEFNDEGPALYGHLVWKDKNSDSLVGAIGCTAEILVNAPTVEVLNPDIAEDLEEAKKKLATTPSETPVSTVLCRGGYRFVVKEVIKTIPYPVAIIDEIKDDADEDDSDMFSSVSFEDNDDDDDDDEEDDDDYAHMTARELIGKTMLGIQRVVSQKLEDTTSKQMSPLEQSILEDSGMSVDPAAIELMQAEEMMAVWEVFQANLVDDIEPHDRKYAIAIMAAELADMNNEIRQQVLLTRNSEERLRIVLKELDEKVGMATARKLATQITDKVDDSSRDLKVGQPQLPVWARSIVKGTRVEYFWNEDYGWVAGEVIEDPMTVVDELLLTIRFDDGETHRLPLTADEKVRWRPPQ